MVQVKKKSEHLRRKLFMAAIRFLNRYMGLVYRRKNLPDPRSVTRIAALQMSGIGDLLLTTPALAALCNIYPNAQIDIITYRRENASFLLRLPDVRKCIPFPLFDLELKSVFKPSFWQPFMRPVREIRNGQYDIYISFHHTWLPQWFLMELLLAAVSGARFRIGINPHYVRGRGFFDSYISEEELEDKHYRRFYLDLVHLLGDFDKDEAALFPLRQAEKDAAKDYIGTRMPNIRGSVCLHMGASHENKRWPPDSYRALSERLIASGYGIILIGIEEERHLTNNISKSLPKDQCMDMAGKTSVFRMAAFIDASALFIGNDSGPLHIAIARKRPAIGLVFDEIPRYHGYNSDEAAILFSERSYHSNNRMADKLERYDWNISVDQVYGKAMKKLLS